MTAPSAEDVLATIRSRSAILPLPRMSAADMDRIVREYYGLPGSGAHAASFRDIYSCLEAQGGGALAIQKDLTRFLCFIGDASGNREQGADAAFFAFAKDLEKRRVAVPFLTALADRIADSLIAKETSIGREGVAPTLRRHKSGFLRRVLRETRTLAAGIQTNNFSASQGIVALVQAFFMEE
jgi:hypothetical protein